MPRQPRVASKTGVYHFMTRGVNKKRIFHTERDYLFYLKLIREQSRKLGLSLYHYCVLPNHAHLLIKARDLNHLSAFGYFTHRKYAHYYEKKYHVSGQVFRRGFKSIPIHNDAYLLECGRYIERNPLDAAIVKRLEEYPYSSFSYYDTGRANSIITPSPAYEEFGRTVKERRAAYKIYVGHNRVKEQQDPTVPF